MLVSIITSASSAGVPALPGITPNRTLPTMAAVRELASGVPTVR